MVSRTITYLAGDGVRLAELVTPVPASNGHNGQLGEDDRPTNGGGDFLGALDTKTDVTIFVTDGDNGLNNAIGYLNYRFYNRAFS